MRARLERSSGRHESESEMQAADPVNEPMEPLQAALWATGTVAAMAAVAGIGLAAIRAVRTLLADRAAWAEERAFMAGLARLPPHIWAAAVGPVDRRRLSADQADLRR